MRADSSRERRERWSKCVFTWRSGRPVARSVKSATTAIRGTMLPQLRDPATAGVSESATCRQLVSSSRRVS
ncbi:hypothetical protein BC477_05030 [Clavibacter michiganensis subsp. michiganensis]|uniref:Uncharacterized protein n=1 Tax=Clavibacter michiganensis subsp. michiganensis TaxID=33013 RepID=A0A251XLL1_CLAMM|nr:hypothetical protein BC477_05030 [Clavibacter michiganensis subsp. michiganensis]OUE04079.1 hypothetical protein CMMCAS07_03960 [Clavibacter michiganensis subsp. michiganensis]